MYVVIYAHFKKIPPLFWFSHPEIGNVQLELEDQSFQVEMRLGCNFKLLKRQQYLDPTILQVLQSNLIEDLPA